MPTVRLAHAAAVLVIGACCTVTGASVSIHSGFSLIPDAQGVATFDDLGPGDSLFGYEEDGLRLSLDDIQGGGFVPEGFDGSGFYYPSGGGFDLINVTRTDGLAFDALEMNVSSGLAAGSPNYMWIQAWDDGGLVGEFDIDVAQGSLIGLTGVFDEVRLGSYFSAAQRDAHETTNLNVLALDNVAFGTVPGPGALALLVVAAGATRRRRASPPACSTSDHPDHLEVPPHEDTRLLKSGQSGYAGCGSRGRRST